MRIFVDIDKLTWFPVSEELDQDSPRYERAWLFENRAITGHAYGLRIELQLQRDVLLDRYSIVSLDAVYKGDTLPLRDHEKPKIQLERTHHVMVLRPRWLRWLGRKKISFRSAYNWVIGEWELQPDDEE